MVGRVHTPPDRVDPHAFTWALQTCHCPSGLLLNESYMGMVIRYVDMMRILILMYRMDTYEIFERKRKDYVGCQKWKIKISYSSQSEVGINFDFSN